MTPTEARTTLHQPLRGRAGHARLAPDRLSLDLADRIDAAVCALTGIAQHLLYATSQKTPLVFARHTAIYLVRQYTALTLSEIGHRYLLRPGTVLVVIRKIEALRDFDSNLQTIIELVGKLASSTNQ